MSRIYLGVLALLILPCSLVQAGRTIEERKSADPAGVVEIVNVSGSVEVQGWDRPEVEVTGSAGSNIERVDVAVSGTHTSVRVVSRSSHSWGPDDEAHIVVRVPAKSMVSATLVSADVKLSGLQSDVKLQTVSGDISGDVGGDVRASTVSGDVKLTAHGAKVTEIKTISGDITLGGAVGDVDITTVSGSAKLTFGNVSRARFKSVSGDMSATLGLDPDAQVEGETVSGEIHLEFASSPAAEFDVQSFSGTIENCFGPKATESRYGPGSRLTFKNGEGGAHVRADTKSGDVQLCFKGNHATHGASLSTVGDTAPRRSMFPYVL